MGDADGRGLDGGYWHGVEGPGASKRKEMEVVVSGFVSWWLIR